MLVAAAAPAASAAVTFTGPTNFPTGTTPSSVAVGDFNGDARPDLAVANRNSSNVSILLGDGTGGFTGPTNFPVAFPQSVAVGDFNGDSHQDLAVASSDANVSPNHVSILLGDGSGGFTGPTNFTVGTSPFSVVVGNFDGDSVPDLAVANFSSNNVSILLGDGSGGFTGPTNFPAGTGPASVAVGDFNGDSLQDLAVANFSSNNVSILLGDGSGGFTGPANLGGASRPLSVVTHDFNGDSRPDLAIANAGSVPCNGTCRVSILLGDGSGGFTGPTDFTAGDRPRSLAVGDFDGDSRPDLAVANQNSGDVSILLGDGSGGFTGPTNFPTGTVTTSSVAVGDFGGDVPGEPRLDLAVAGQGTNYVSILLNTTVPDGTPGCTVKINNKSSIVADNGDPATFSGTVKQTSASGISGGEDYLDQGPADPLVVSSTSISSVVCSGTAASIYGTATVNGVGSHAFRIDVQDLGEPGRFADTYRIRLDTGYDSGAQQLRKGNVQIH